MDEKQIKEIVELVKQGNQQAFEDLYELSKKSVYFICISLLNSEEDAKDVMQDTYLTAYNNLYQLNDCSKFIPWINQIAVNKCKRIVLKKNRIFTDIDDMENIQQEQNENFLPEEYITQKEKRKIVMDIMRKSLSDIQYRTVILYYFNGLTVEEVADIMECPPGTVKYRLSVARAKIRDGVLSYENKNNEKLYSVAAVPFLTYLFFTEANEIFVPNILPTLISSIRTASSTATTSVATKVGAGLIKKKVVIGIVSVAVIGTGATAIVLGNKPDKKDDNSPKTEYDIPEDDSLENIESNKPFSGDWEKEERYGYSPFWIKYANLSSYGKRDIDKILCNDTFYIGDNLEEILQREWHHFKIEDEDIYGYEELVNFSGDLGWDNNQLKPLGYSGDFVELFAYYTEDEYVEICIYNLTDEYVDLGECILSNSYSIEENGFLLDYCLGLDVWERSDFRRNMQEIIPMFGEPDYAFSSLNSNVNTDREGNDETVEETINYGGGSLVYSLLYDKGDYVVCIECAESNYFGKYDGYSRISIYSKSVYDYYNSGNHPVFIQENEFNIK